MGAMHAIKQIALFLAISAVSWSNTAAAALGTPPLQELQESVSQAVAQVRPSMVSIKAMKKKRADGAGANGFIWFESIGSGFVVDERGYILTNYHVVEGSESITVNLWRAGQDALSARIEHTDPSLDLTVLKIDGQDPVAPATLGNSDRIKTGDWVISVGSPFGFEHSASLGIVSDLHRDLLIGKETYRNMIQTDAVINEGNSGGPLIDIQGNVIGIGTAIYAPEGTYTGLGFAIPINRARHFITHVTGAMRMAALTAPAPQGANKEPVNLNKRMPGDKIHAEFTDCTQCHTITQKMVVSQQVAMPHPMVGDCSICHILVNEPKASGPVKVANVTPIPPPRVDEGLGDLLVNPVFLLTILIVVASAVFARRGVGGVFQRLALDRRDRPCHEPGGSVDELYGDTGTHEKEQRISDQ